MSPLLAHPTRTVAVEPDARTTRTLPPIMDERAWRLDGTGVVEDLKTPVEFGDTFRTRLGDTISLGGAGGEGGDLNPRMRWTHCPIFSRVP